MPSAITSIALFAPAVASNAIFSVRRASRGVEAIDENPLYGIMNMNIAAGQVLKGTKAVNELAKLADPNFVRANEGATKAIKETSKMNKVLKGAGKVVKFTADHINPIICATGAVKVLTADDKVDEYARESTSLLCMFGAEATAKKLVGLPETKEVNGIKVTTPREGLLEKGYEKLFSDKQKIAIKQFSETKRFMKYVPGTAKGLLFVGASIGGYKLGDFISNSILGERKKAS